MAQQATNIGSGLIALDRNGDILSGISTGVPSNSFSIRSLASGRREPGFVCLDGSLSEWNPKGFVEHDGTIYVTGPQVAGVFLDEAMGDPDRDHLADVTRVADALASLRLAERTLRVLHLRSMLLLDSGGVLVVPSDIGSAILEYCDLGERLRISEPYSHPDKRWPESVGFFLAALTYRALTGDLPFEGSSAEEIHAKIRTGKPVPARYRRFTLGATVSQALDATLGGETYEPDPAVWAERLRSWRQDGPDDALNPNEIAAIRADAENEIARLDRSFDRKESVRKGWRTWLIVALIVAAVGSVPGTIIRNSLKPRATAGLSPEQVVETFYTSINSLDHMTMEDAVIDGAARNLIREVMTLYVVDRQRMAVEMESGFVDAATWRAEGMPPLAPGVSPYGVANLTITPTPAPDGTAFRVSYERWMPIPGDDPENPPPNPYTGFRMVDDVHLRQDKGDWVIDALTPRTSEEMDLEALRQAAAATGSSER